MANNNYTTITSGDETFGWTQYNLDSKGGEFPSQGWKIHISANAYNFEKIQSIILPILMEDEIVFKHVRDIDSLNFLNSGKGGNSQIGKAFTIYPQDVSKFVTLCKKLYSVTKNKKFKAPFIPSDRQYADNGIVYYRYGSFSEQTIQNDIGLYIPALFDPEKKEFIEENRSIPFDCPGWVQDPFNPNTEVLDFKLWTNLIFKEQYVFYKMLNFSYKAITYVAFDLKDDLKPYVFKAANHHVVIDEGVTSENMIENEARILKKLAKVPHTPDLISVSNVFDKKCLISTAIEGFTLTELVNSMTLNGVELKGDDLTQMMLSICEAVKSLHDNKVIHLDLKPENILIDENGNVFIIDFETAIFENEWNSKNKNISTRGFYASDYFEEPDPYQRDLYAVGAMLYFLCTNLHPANTTRQFSMLELPVSLLNNNISSNLESIVQQCLEKKYSSIDAIIEALKSVETEISLPQKNNHKKALTIDKSVFANISKNIAAHLLDSAQVLQKGISWESTHSYNSGKGFTDINIGSSGILLFLINSLFYEVNPLKAETKEVIKRGCYFLENEYQNNALNGLYVGKSGIATILSLANLLLETDRFSATINTINNLIFENLPKHPDLFNGMAGCGMHFLFQYILHEDEAYLEQSKTVFDQITAHRKIIDDEFHLIASSGSCLLGAGHGLAGVGIFYSELYRMMPDNEILREIQLIENTISKYEVTGLEGKGLNYPNEPEVEITHMQWCHGAVGIGEFYTSVRAILPDKLVNDKLQKIGKFVAHSSSWQNPVRCHGLAGAIEFLIDLNADSPSKEWKEAIAKLAMVIKMKTLIKDDVLLFHSESPEIVTPDYMVGYSGIADTLMRINNTSLPKSLTVKHIKYLKSKTQKLWKI